MSELNETYAIIYNGNPVICCSSLDLLYEFLVVNSNNYNLLVFPVLMVLRTLFVKSWKVSLDTADNQEFTIYRFEILVSRSQLQD